MSMDDTLLIHEIFYSLQGETRTTGIPTLFIRLTGCPLRCVYCDTEYAFKGGERKSLADLVAIAQSHPMRHITITGGEPLAQPQSLTLMEQLCDLGYIVSLETSGALSIEHVDTRVSRVLDLKTPGSGESHRNLLSNIAFLTDNDQIKFVITDQKDFAWAIELIEKYNLTEKAEVFFSPSFEQAHPKDLAKWVLASKLPIRMQLQIHKYIWGDIPGH